MVGRDKIDNLDKICKISMHITYVIFDILCVFPQWCTGGRAFAASTLLRKDTVVLKSFGHFYFCVLLN